MPDAYAAVHQLPNLPPATLFLRYAGGDASIEESQKARIVWKFDMICMCIAYHGLGSGMVLLPQQPPLPLPPPLLLPLLLMNHNQSERPPLTFLQLSYAMIHWLQVPART